MDDKFYIGIDIGLHGAIAVIKGRNIKTLQMPVIKKVLDINKLSKLFSKFKNKNCIVVHEKLGSIFGSSKATALSMGYQMGAIEGICAAYGLANVPVAAKVWQSEMFIGVREIMKPAKKTSKTGKPTRDTKAMALCSIKQRFPNLKLTFGEKSKKPHDGLVDSVLLAEYSRMKNL